ncbi:hypothetical protein IEQ34_015931 [Dendrobium chrysotoxum]|uniref:Cytochrome P450 n=1 Tax=Dendrobium chrysotoxum TaxID=161865 RepID=A0AAV7GJT3_DENCH|nr:hypothetical protein IEQ34_015931 [Dendrobium chrysotoxum]
MCYQPTTDPASFNTNTDGYQLPLPLRKLVCVYIPQTSKHRTRSNMVINSQETLTHPLLLLLPFLFLVFTVYRRRKPALNLPPGPPPHPIFGNLKDLGENPHITFYHLSKKYGPLIHVNLGQIRTMFVCDADTASEVLKAQDQIFCSRAQLTSLKRFTYGGKDLAFCPFNDHWKQLRRLCNTEVFSLGRVQSFHSFRREEVDALINTISQTSARGETVNVSQMAFCYFNNLIFREVFGKRVSPEGECGWSPLQGLLREVVSSMSQLGTADLFPWFGWLDLLTGWQARLDKVYEKMDLVYEEKIREHMARISEGKLDSDDFLDVLLHLLANEGSSLTMDQIKGLLMNMFTAGTDTSAVTMEMGMTRLIKNPEALNKVQEEVRQVAGDKGLVEESDLQHLPYLKQVIKETLRLHPPGPLLPPRESMKDAKVNGYDIPAKTMIYVDVYSIGRDPKYWEDPEVFRPERFENSSVNFKGSNLEFIPFGAGRRLCPGIALAMANVELAFANMLYRFNWTLPEGMTKEDVDLRPKPGLTTPKLIPLVLVATPAFTK